MLITSPRHTAIYQSVCRSLLDRCGSLWSNRFIFLMLLLWCHLLLSGFQNKGYLPRVPPQSCLSGNKRENEANLRVVNTSSGIYLQLGKTLKKAQLGQGQKALRITIVSNEAPYLHITSAELHSTSGRETKKKEERMWIYKKKKRKKLLRLEPAPAFCPESEQFEPLDVDWIRGCDYASAPHYNCAILY